LASQNATDGQLASYFQLAKLVPLDQTAKLTDLEGSQLLARLTPFHTAQPLICDRCHKGDEIIVTVLQIPQIGIKWALRQLYQRITERLFSYLSGHYPSVRRMVRTTPEAHRKRAMASNTDPYETAVSISIVTARYRARCAAPGCHNLGRLISRYADARGRPIIQLKFCHAHGRVRIPRHRATGIRVWDDRA
jgi:hypothetical protein